MLIGTKLRWICLINMSIDYCNYSSLKNTTDWTFYIENSGIPHKRDTADLHIIQSLNYIDNILSAIQKTSYIHCLFCFVNIVEQQIICDYRITIPSFG